MLQEVEQKPLAKAFKEISEVMSEYPNMPVPNGNTEYFLVVVAQMLLRIENRLRFLEQIAQR